MLCEARASKSFCFASSESNPSPQPGSDDAKSCAQPRSKSWSIGAKDKARLRNSQSREQYRSSHLSLLPRHFPTLLKAVEPHNELILRGDFMKHRMLALILALTVASWAQTATQPATSASPAGAVTTEKTKCPCCDKMADSGAKAEHSCCAHEAKAADGKEKGCCGGKDAKTCARGDKTAASCCKDSCGKDKTTTASCGKSCGKECKKGCCASPKKTEAAMRCCARGLRA